MTTHGPAARTPSSWRTRAELLRARMTQLVGLRAAGAGVIVGLGAILAKVILGELAGGDTGYILLVAAVVLAAWIGGVPAGLAATISGLLVNSIVFIRPGVDLVAQDTLEAWKQVLFLLIGSAKI